jgi:hypothetical protein
MDFPQPIHEVVQESYASLDIFSSIMAAMQLAGWQIVGVMVLCAELMLIIVRAAQIQIVVKPDVQRSASERTMMHRGLARSLILEAIVFVPASVVLVFVTIRPLALLAEPIRIRTAASSDLSMAFYGGLGLGSYGFPFGFFRKVVARIALNSLKEFAAIANSSIDGA